MRVLTPGHPAPSNHRRRRGFAGLLCLLVTLVLSQSPVLGQSSLQPLVQKLASKDRAQLQEAVVALGGSDHPAALTLLQALSERDLRLDATGRALIKRDGKYFDALAGTPVENPGELQTPVVSNTIRRALKSAMARQGLRSPDVQVRKAAAEDLAGNVDADMAPDIRAALARESDNGVQELLAGTLAKLDLASDDPTNRLRAIETIGSLGQTAFKPELKAIVEPNPDGSYAEPDPKVRKAAQSVLLSLERKEMLVRVLRDLFYGLSLGSVLLLAALGLAITFGLMGVINMAHGEMLMLGAYTTYMVQSAFESAAPGATGYYLLAAVPAAFLVCMAVGVLLERTVIRFLYGRPLETLLATWGISLGLIQIVRLVFGAANVTVANPDWLSGGWEPVTGVVLPYTRLATILFVALVVSFVWYLLNRTRLGLEVRAITQNRAMAECMGIRTARVDMLAFGIGSGVAGLGGVALSQIGNVGPELGQAYIVDSFMVVVVGGVGKLIGTVAAALGLGTVTKVLEPISGAVLGKIFVLAFIILFIQRRPQGLFALKGRAAEM